MYSYFVYYIEHEHVCMLQMGMQCPIVLGCYFCRNSPLPITTKEGTNHPLGKEKALPPTSYGVNDLANLLASSLSFSLSGSETKPVHYTLAVFRVCLQEQHTRGCCSWLYHTQTRLVQLNKFSTQQHCFFHQYNVMSRTQTNSTPHSK